MDFFFLDFQFILDALALDIKFIYFVCELTCGKQS